MKMNKRAVWNVLAFVSILWLAACSNTIKPATDPAERAEELVMALPEVQKASKIADKETDGRNKIVAQVGSWEADSPLIYVTVFEDNGDNLVSRYRFLYNPETDDLQFYDHLADEVISLEAWRKP